MNKAQSLTEYALVLGLIVVTIVSLQTFFRRGLQAHIKQASDQFAWQEDWIVGEFTYSTLETGSSDSESEQRGYVSSRVDTTGWVINWENTNTSNLETSLSSIRTEGY